MGVLTSCKRHRKVIQICFILCIFLFCTFYLSPFYSSLQKNYRYNASRATLIKPHGIIVSGLIFYGRRDRVSCMYCYLRQNMVDQGGWLDEVLWVVNTEDNNDLQYLNEILASDPIRHKKLEIAGGRLFTHTYFKAWQHLERGKYYVKIDDDIVWFNNDTIPQLVTRKFHHQEDFVVSANIINNPPLGFLHFHMGALHPYLPETVRPDFVPESWEPSHHGFWRGPQNSTWALELGPPYPGHRWLRVEEESMIMQTPITNLKYEVWGNSYSSWAIATQMHYSLFENIEKDALGLYMFTPPWVMHGERIRINFMCIYADDILDTGIENWPNDRGDEDMIVLDLPQKLRRFVILGNALAAHLQYQDQPEIGETDVLKRYQLLARDNGCL